MSDFTSVMSVGSVTGGKANKAPSPAATTAGNLYGELEKITICERPGLATLPPEILLNTLSNLEKKKDWLSLARTCRRLSVVAVPELDKYNVEDGQYYALWYACVANKPAILLRHLAYDATVANRYFTSDFRHERVSYKFGRDMTPLAVAIVAGRDTIVQLLLINGADANLSDRVPVLQNQVLWYPINWAVASKYESSVPIIKMLGVHSADMDQVPKTCVGNDVEFPPGMKCAPIFRLLMLEKPRLRASRRELPTSCELFNNDLHKAQDLRLRQLTALLQSGADANKPYDRDLVTPVFFLLTSLTTYTPSFYFSNRLMLSHEGDAQTDLVNEITISFLETLYSFGADIYSPGHIYFYREQMAREISATFPETPLHVACRLNDRHKPVIHWFLRNGAPINGLGGALNTPLMAYCDSTFTDVDQFREFLNAGPVINNKDMLGRTALHNLCANHKLRPQVKEKAVRMLLNRGADPTAVSNEGLIPSQEIALTVACFSTDEDVVLMLEEAAKEWKQRKGGGNGKGKSKGKKRKVLSESRPMTYNEHANDPHEGSCPPGTSLRTQNTPSCNYTITQKGNQKRQGTNRVRS